MNPVVQNIAAAAGTTGVAGNRLCSVAGLVSGSGTLPNRLNSLAGVLNQVVVAR